MRRTRWLLPFLTLLLACTGEPPGTGDGYTMAVTLGFSGLWTNPNSLSGTPENGATLAENVVSDRPGVATPRRAQEVMAHPYTVGTDRLSSGTVYGGYDFEHTTGGRLFRRDGNTSVTLVASGVIGPDSRRVHFASIDGALFLTTSSGVKYLDGAGAALNTPGAPKVLGMWARTGVVGTLLPEGASAAYRATVVRTRPDGRTMEGEPSGRWVALNDGLGTRDVAVDVHLPDDIVVGDVVRVYRTAIATGGTDPGDVMHLVKEFAVDALAVTSKALSGYDTQPDSLRGQALYTNATEEGIQQANVRPPLVRDLAVFRNYLFGADVTQPQRLTFRLLAVPAIGDQLEIDGRVYTADVATDVPSRTFGVSTTGDVAYDIAETTRRLIFIINSDPDPACTLVASYASGDSDAPGIISIESSVLGDAAFTAQVVVGSDIYEPLLATPVSSLADRHPHGIAVSKQNMPYAFPLRDSRYLIRVGSAEKRVLRVVALRDSLWAFKENEGIWRIDQTVTSWSPVRVSEDTHLVAPEALAVVDNQIFALTTRGVVSVSDGGIEEVDVQIADKLDTILQLPRATLEAHAVAAADPDALRWFLWYPTTSTSTYAERALVYNGRGGDDGQGAWTERTDGATAAYLPESDRRLRLGLPASANVSREKKTGAASDYLDTVSPVHVALEWAATTYGVAATPKHFRETDILFGELQSGAWDFTYTDDYGNTETLHGEAEGLPICAMWVPDDVARTVRLKVKVEHDMGAELVNILGLKVLAERYDGEVVVR